MINKASILRLNEKRKDAHDQHPLYREYGFSCLPDTMSKLLTGEGKNALLEPAVGGCYERYDCVLLFLFDGFGWEFFEKYADRYPALQRLLKEGIVSQISSEFPSTTASHLTTLHTGKEVGETGVYEWFQYEPLVDQMIAPLLFSYAGEHEPGGLVKEGYAPEQLFPFTPLYKKWAKKGVRSLIFQQEKIAHSPYSRALLDGAEIHSFSSFADVLVRVVEYLRCPCQQPTYLFVYLGEMDAAGHRHGLDSVQFADAVDACWSQIEECFWQKLVSLPNKTAVMFTADHGMTAVDPKTTMYLNDLVPDLGERVKKNKRGKLLVPAGSCRDFFLHIQEPLLKSTAELLAQRLSGVAHVALTQQLIRDGFFGAHPVSQRFLDRVGNLVVLPEKGHSAFWRFDKHHFEQHFYAAHGGLSTSEMHSIFSFVPL